MGGTFYAREAPHLPPLVEEGDHFEAGQPLFVIEVMKMFNKVLAPFSGTVTENLMADRDGTVVKKGQTIFAIEPDERVEPESESARAAACARRRWLCFRRVGKRPRLPTSSEGELSRGLLPRAAGVPFGQWLAG